MTEKPASITLEEYHRLTRRKKYGNKLETIGALHFDSKAEARRWRDLETLQAGGAISQLTHHPRYPLSVNGVLVCTYEADSSYLDHAYAPAKLTIEDVKSVATKTPAYAIKRKLLLAVYKMDIVEVEA